MASPAEAPPIPAPVLERLLGGPAASLELLAGGRNSRVYRVRTPAGASFALKAYFRHPGDLRDRLGTEMAALGFLREQGLRCVPRPLAADPEAGLGLYEFIEGEVPVDPTPDEVDEAAAFLVQVQRLGAQPAAADLPLASEARFSLAGVADHVEARLQALVDGAPALAGFLDGELVPVWKEALARCQRACAGPGLAFDADLAPGQRTLSPSDFGFHNALRRKGELVFLDFEYFGWDDPAKLVADLLLHPGSGLTRPLRVRLAEGVLRGQAEPDWLRARVRRVHALFGVKWCIILLNEFLPGPLGRRRFAAPGAGSAEDRQAVQLEKARNLLHAIRDDHDPFA